MGGLWNKMKEKILIGMSGGLDSTYSAYLCREAGYEVTGAVLRMSDETDITAAQTAAEELGIPLHVVDMRQPFETNVMQYFADEYACGRTPNPCVQCNRHVKVAGLVDLARALGIPSVVTGHYARITFDPARRRYFVQAAGDLRKDQSYVLWALTQEQLSMLKTPLSEIGKEEIRAHASALGLRVAVSKESQDICFLPDGDYVSFVTARRGEFPPGDFVDERGAVVGRHKGIIRYTVGQRKGHGIALGHPVFVTSIDACANTVHLAPSGMEYEKSLTLSALNFQRIGPSELCEGMRVFVKIRYAAARAPATVSKIGADSLTLTLDTPQRAVTPGQSGVCYDGEGGILFGGTIL